MPLRLAAMLIYQRQDAAVLDKALQICERSLLDYLDAEVIGQLPGRRADVSGAHVHLEPV